MANWKGGRPPEKKDPTMHKYAKDLSQFSGYSLSAASCDGGQAGE